jgi:hypothetical protein
VLSAWEVSVGGGVGIIVIQHTSSPNHSLPPRQSANGQKYNMNGRNSAYEVLVRNKKMAVR